METNPPRFRLQDMPANGSSAPDSPARGGRPELVPLVDTEWTRRAFVTAFSGMSALAVLANCGGGGGGGTGVAPAPLTPEQLSEFTGLAVGGQADIIAIAISPDGHYLATGGGLCRGEIDTVANVERGNLKLWSLLSGELLATIGVPLQSVRPQTQQAIAFRPDSTMLAAGTGGGRVRVFNVPGGELVHDLLVDTSTIPVSTVHGVAWSPDGLLLAACGDDGRVRLIDATTGAVVRTATGVTLEWFFSCKFHPSGQFLVTVSGNGNRGRTRIWSVPELNPVAEIPVLYPGEWVRGLAISGDGQRLVTASEFGADRQVRLYDFATRQLLLSLQSGGWISDPSFSPDDRLLVAGDGGHVVVYRTDNGARVTEERVVSRATGSTFRVALAAFAPDGRTLVTAFQDVAKIWDLPEYRFRTSLFDPSASRTGSSISYYSIENASGARVFYSAPCGSQLPGGAQCSCNCVDAGFRGERCLPTFGGNMVSITCVCVPVRIG